MCVALKIKKKEGEIIHYSNLALFVCILLNIIKLKYSLPVTVGVFLLLSVNANLHIPSILPAHFKQRSRNLS